MKMVDGSTVRHGRVDWRVHPKRVREGEGGGGRMVHSDRTGRHTQEQVEVKEVRERERERRRRRWREDGVNLSSRVQRRGRGGGGRRREEKSIAGRNLSDLTLIFPFTVKLPVTQR